ncbi:hypothetical protein RclHR1_12650012 [Rhizophagus clarus]|uniref:Uncharacterized protein n=1 Tax=Rhizophagus clarus TaxID=94130 RepID=A0A2Z6QKA0_9GLOM|nr:hypothetical protein RclHR1_12650012 [Rhizophagus clarus]GES82874.1 hypothetical protein RCL_jg15876.t1 [Rhizophagus clarus]
MSLLDALNRLNETDESLEIEEKIKNSSITENGIDKQVNGIIPGLANKNTKKENQSYLQNESNLLADILDSTLTPTGKEIEKKIESFATKSESRYLKSRLKNHSIEPKKYDEYLKIYLKQPRNDNQSIKDQDIDLDNMDEDNIFALSSWQKEIAEGQNVSLQSEYIEMKSREFAKMNTRIPIFSNGFIKKVVSYCISRNPDGTPNMKFWSASLFQYLIEKNLLSDSYVKDGIVKAFIERNSWGILKLAIIHVSDIPEKDLVYLLKYLISQSFSKQLVSNSSPSSQKEKKKTKKPSIEEFFALIICAPRNDSKMMEALKSLNENELFHITQTLCKWVEKHDKTEIIFDTTLIEPYGKYEFSSKKAAVLKKIKDVPDFHFVIDFMTLIFDIHFPTFVISKKFHPLLTHISDLITQELTIYESLESMRGCLELFHQNHQEIERKRKSEKMLSTEQLKDNGKKNNYWLNDGDIPTYSVELFSFFGEENENPVLDEDEYGDDNDVQVELDNDDDTNKEQEKMTDSN